MFSIIAAMHLRKFHIYLYPRDTSLYNSSVGESFKIGLNTSHMALQNTRTMFRTVLNLIRKLNPIDQNEIPVIKYLSKPTNTLIFIAFEVQETWSKLRNCYSNALKRCQGTKIFTLEIEKRNSISSALFRYSTVNSI